MKNIIKIASFSLLAASPMLASIHAADYPIRPVKFVVPWPPGDLEDTLTRIIAKEMSSETGIPASVLNKPGGGGVVGATEVARSRNDGSVIGSFVADLLTTQLHSGNTSYQKDAFEPIGIFLEYPFVIATRSKQPYNTLEELATYSNNNKVSLGHFGYQALPTALTYKAADQLNIQFSSDAAFDNNDCPVLLNGDADVVTTTISQINACMQTGEVKLLASITRERLSISPQTPTLKEITNISQTTWNGLFVKKGTSDKIKNRIAEIAEAAVNTVKAQSYVATTGAGIFWIGKKESEKIIEKDFQASKALLKYMKN